MTTLAQDLRHAVHVLLGAKAWTLVILLSLALGIGANTALFTAVNGLLLQTVSVPEPEREPSAIGRVVSINGQMVTVVGVTPADFAGIERLGGDAPDVTVPLRSPCCLRASASSV